LAARQSRTARAVPRLLDCFVAPLLAMTVQQVTFWTRRYKHSPRKRIDAGMPRRAGTVAIS
jgi:hypothetical protein